MAVRRRRPGHCAQAGRDVVPALVRACSSRPRILDGEHLPAWTRMLPGPASRIGRAGETGTPTWPAASRITLDLDARVNRRPLTQVLAPSPSALRDVLLTGLALAVAEAGSERSVLIDLEGHGREDVVDGADVTSTIGWFNQHLPGADRPREAAPGPRPITGSWRWRMVKDVKEQRGPARGRRSLRLLR